MQRIFPPLCAILLAVILFNACKKEGDTTGSSTSTSTATPATKSNVSVNSQGRYASDNYSQSISISTANSMIGSYLSSVNYPAQDTAIRSFAFDADTLRTYLADTSIKTLRFHIAHNPTYVQQNSGKYAGYKPAALTLVIVGYSTEDQLIKNKQNGVYEHAYPCPTFCHQGGGLLQ